MMLVPLKLKCTKLGQHAAFSRKWQTPLSVICSEKENQYIEAFEGGNKTIELNLILKEGLREVTVTLV